MVRCYCGLDFYPEDGYDIQYHLGSTEHLVSIQKKHDLKDRTEEAFTTWPTYPAKIYVNRVIKI